MKSKLLTVILFLSFFSISFSQSPQEITKYLETKYTYNSTLSVGFCYYTNTELPKVYNDPVLKKYLPDVTIYTFIINEKGCYGAQPRIALMFSKDGKLTEYLGLWWQNPDEGNQELMNIIKEIRLTNSKKFNVYMNSIAKLLFCTYYQNEFVLVTSKMNSQMFCSQDNGNLELKFSNNQITDIKYSTSL